MKVLSERLLQTESSDNINTFLLATYPILCIESHGGLEDRRIPFHPASQQIIMDHANLLPGYLRSAPLNSVRTCCKNFLEMRNEMRCPSQTTKILSPLINLK